MDRSSRSKEKKDKVYDYPKAAASRFESEYSRSYTKPNAKESPYRNSSCANSSAPTNVNGVRVNKPQTPYPSHSSARNFYRSSTAVPATFHTLNTINKMEQILKKSVGIPSNETPPQNSSQNASARGLTQSAKLNGHMSQIYGMNGNGIEHRSDESGSNSKRREGDNSWSVDAPKLYDRVSQETQSEQHCIMKEDQRRKGQGDNSPGSAKIPNRSILTKPKSGISINSMTNRWSMNKYTANKAKSQKKVRFSDNITTHLVPYEERGSQEWRKNILAMNMNYRSYLGGYPNLRSLSLPMPLPDFTYKSNRPSTTSYSYEQSLLMPLMPSSSSGVIGNDWNSYGNTTSALCGQYQVEPDLNRHFDTGLQNTKKPKSPYHDKGVYNFPTPRRQ